MFIPVIRVSEQDSELIGVVPSPDTIEKATPSDIINKPVTNNIILLNIPTLQLIFNIFFINIHY